MTHRYTLIAVYWTAVVMLVLPLTLIVLTATSATTIVGFPVGAPSLRWFVAAVTDPAYQRAFALSVILALGSAILALVAGTWIAVAAAAAPWRWLRLALIGGALVPLVTPGIVHAIALRITIRIIGLDPGLLAILVGHAIHATPYAAIMVGARLATLPPEWIDAAHDLGAGPIQTFVNITLPWLRKTLLGASVLAALTSFDDFIRSFFLGGYDPTLPVLIFGRLRSGLTPEINAVATITVIVAAIFGVILDRLAQRKATFDL